MPNQQSPFTPISWQRAGSQQEYDQLNAQNMQELQRREDMNRQIDWMNQMLQANPGNASVGNSLMKQYMGLTQPQDTFGDTMGRASDLAQLGQLLGNQDATSAASAMLTPLLAQYGINPGTSDGQSTGQKALQEQKLSQFGKDVGLYNDKGEMSTGNDAERLLKVYEAAMKNPDLVNQYYNYSPSFTERFASLPGQTLNTPWQTLTNAFNDKEFKLRNLGF